jgi:hypothetical protein
MTQDEIIDKDEVLKMARQAGFTEIEFYGNKVGTNVTECLESFAKLVAAKEREEILAMSKKQWFRTQHDQDEAIRARGEPTSRGGEAT